MDSKALFNIGYGLYILSTYENGKDNGCIINTVIQTTDQPLRIAICVNKNNYTNTMLQKTKKFNISVLSQSANFDIFKNFGYQCGKDIDKFANIKEKERASNGILFVTQNTNAYFSANVQQEIDLDTHTMYITQVVDSKILSEEQSLTYDFYKKNIKPAPQTTSQKGWRCKICNYIYENENLPSDFVCPICKHGIIDFEKPA